MVKDCFAKTLRSMLHSRIDYPKDETGKGEQERRRAQGDGDAERAATKTRGRQDGRAAGRPGDATQRPGKRAGRSRGGETEARGADEGPAAGCRSPVGGGLGGICRSGSRVGEAAVVPPAGRRGRMTGSAGRSRAD